MARGVFGKIVFGTVAIVLLMVVVITNPEMKAWVVENDAILGLGITLIFTMGFFMRWKSKG